MSGFLGAVAQATSVIFSADGGVVLGDVVFTGVEVPDTIAEPTSQALDVKRQPGGTVFIQAFGPVFEPITWTGYLEGPFALDRAQQLKQIMLDAAPVPLSWLDSFYTVVVEKFRTRPHTAGWIPYSITCRVLQDETNPPAPPDASIDSQVGDDTNTASDTLAAAPGAGTPATPVQGQTLPTPPIPPGEDTGFGAAIAAAPVTPATPTPGLPASAPAPEAPGPTPYPDFTAGGYPIPGL